MKNSNGYTLVGLAILVSLLTVGTIATFNQFVSGGAAVKEVAESEVNFTRNRADSILLTIREARGE